MGRVPHIVPRRKKARRLGLVQILKRSELESLEVDARLEAIRCLIPLGLLYIGEELQREVEALAGRRYRRKPKGKACRRHGTNPGTVQLAGQKIPIRVPRLRDGEGEVPLSSYRVLHAADGNMDEALFRRVLYGVSCRNYEQAAEAIPGAIGLSSSSVSRRFVALSSARLRDFQERDLSHLDIVAMFLDGKSFAEDAMVIAVAVTSDGCKHCLGFVQTGTENDRAVGQFLRLLVDRGLDVSQGLLAVIDGSKGLASALRKAFRGRVLIQRCQWHKRQNVVSYLAKNEQQFWKRRMQRAYERPTYEEAKEALARIRRELAEINESALRSLDEGFEETLTLHRLGLFPLLGRSLKTTNIIESINSQAEGHCGRVDCWQNSNQKHRWLAAALLEIEPRLSRVPGYRHLPALRSALQQELGIADVRKEDECVA